VDDDRLTADALAAAAGDRAALSRFVRATQGEVHRLCAYLVDVDNAADLSQETFLRAIRALPRYRQEAPARLWLLSIARRTCADHLRTRYRHRGIEERIPPRPEAVDAADPSLWALLDSLDADQRAAFVLTQVLGLSYAEAAAAAECPLGTIRSRVARARTTLAELLAQAESDDDPPAVAPATSKAPATGNQDRRPDDWTSDVPLSNRSGPRRHRRGRAVDPGELRRRR
jgi:RNA polymerase sigma-70 factor, ECF subfamily